MNDLRHEGREGLRDDAPAPRPTREEARERLAAIRFWQVQGMDRMEVQRSVMAAWQVSQRTAQKYVRKAGQNLAHEAGREDHLSVLRLSQLQRERLLGHISRRLVNADAIDDKRLVLLVNAARTLLDGRDRAVRAMAMGLTQYVARNEAPKSERKPKPRANGPQKELENVARRRPCRISNAAPALEGVVAGKGVVPSPLSPPGGEGPGVRGLSHTRPHPLTPTLSPKGGEGEEQDSRFAQAVASQPEREAAERAMRERGMNIMEEMESMVSFLRGSPPVAAMGRDPGAAHDRPQQPASLLKSKPHKEMAATAVLVPDGT